MKRSNGMKTMLAGVLVLGAVTMFTGCNRDGGSTTGTSSTESEQQGSAGSQGSESSQGSATEGSQGGTGMNGNATAR
jgi:hypothetical protein